MSNDWPERCPSNLIDPLPNQVTRLQQYILSTGREFPLAEGRKSLSNGNLFHCDCFAVEMMLVNSHGAYIYIF